MKQNNKATIIGMIVITLTSVTCGAIVYKVRAASAAKELVITDGPTTATMHLGKMPQVRLTDLADGKIVNLGRQSDHELRLLTFVSAADCGSCLTILSGINALPARIENSTLSIDTIFVRSSQDEVKTYLRERQQEQPQLYHTYVDSFGDVEREIGLPSRTPVVVLVDSDFDVKVAEGATNSIESQNDFLSAVVQLSSQPQQ